LATQEHCGDNHGRPGVTTEGDVLVSLVLTLSFVFELEFGVIVCFPIEWFDSLIAGTWNLYIIVVHKLCGAIHC
jgi:hypothetical protein